MRVERLEGSPAAGGDEGGDDGDVGVAAESGGRDEGLAEAEDEHARGQVVGVREAGVEARPPQGVGEGEI